MSQALHVVAGVVLDTAGRLLLAQRPQGKHLAGLWEFPGGKVEPGEDVFGALRRELAEELDIRIDSGLEPVIELPWSYGERRLRLQAWRVASWHGRPCGLEGQAWRWLAPGAIDPGMLAPADRAILCALRLPRHLSAPTLAASGADWQPLDGVRIRTLEIAAVSGSRTRHAGGYLGVYCHGLDELAMAVAQGADFALWTSPRDAGRAVAESCLPLYRAGSAAQARDWRRLGWQGSYELFPPVRDAAPASSR